MLTAFTVCLGLNLLQLIAGQTFTFMSVEHAEQCANTSISFQVEASGSLAFGWYVNHQNVEVRFFILFVVIAYLFSSHTTASNADYIE